MELLSIPAGKYDSYREEVIFCGYKWDPQFLDNNTIAKHALVITQQEHNELEEYTKKLFDETVQAENAMLADPGLAKNLKLPRRMRRELSSIKNYKPQGHVRLMRFDFHPLSGGGWAVSEVNSDVPGGFAEASVMPRIAKQYLGGQRDKLDYIDFAAVFTQSINEKLCRSAKIMLVHCTCYSDDRQVMQFAGDKLEAMGHRVIYAAADHLHFDNGSAVSILGGFEGTVDAIIRFSPLEWVIDMKPRHNKEWKGYFTTQTLSCNHPVAGFAQTKRFPLAWDALERQGIALEAWRKLLPETTEAKQAKDRGGFIYKPVWGRVGEGISIREACRGDEYEKIIKDVRRHPCNYIAQKKFSSLPLAGGDGTGYHICIGAFCVDGIPAGYYARISKTARIDSGASDIPVLIETAGGDTTSVPQAGRSTPQEYPSIPQAAPSVPQAAVVSPGVTGKEAFRIWAPGSAKWSGWARPVPFAAAGGNYGTYMLTDRTIPEINYLQKLPADTAVIVDLPGCGSIKEGLALARLGFRPVPLYNGTNEQPGVPALADNHSISIALIWGASELLQLKISGDAPPAFLLDSNRMHTHRADNSVFDNSWDIYEQDMPSAGYLQKEGIDKIIVRSDRIQRDLRKILRKYKKQGITVTLLINS